MANRLVMQAMMIGVVLGMASGAWAEGEIAVPVDQDPGVIQDQILLERALAKDPAQGHVEQLAAVSSQRDMAGLAPKPSPTFDGTVPTVTEQPLPEYNLDVDDEGNPIKPKEVTSIEITEDGSTITEFNDGSGFAIHEDYVVLWDENGKITVLDR